jgi:Fur family ferric uptake transcriptional regulator
MKSPLHSAAMRNTRATVALTALFKDHPDDALSHAEVEQALIQAGVEVNRVTVYRLLDRFVAAGLLQRHVDPHRVSHFSTVDAKSGAWAPRFECESCHRQFRLTDGSEQVKATANKVLKALETLGHEGHEVDISVRGRCAGCAHPSHAPS